MWCGPILTDPAHIAADVGDPLHMAWAMAWVGHQVVRAPLALFQANAFYPYPNSLAFGDHLLPEGLLGLPVNLITGNAVLALNLVTAFGLFSSALAAALVIAKLLDSRGAGLLAGTFIAFNGFMQGELLRVNVLHLQGWSLALLFLWRFTNEPSWRNGWAFSLSLALQGLTGTYYAIYSALLAPGLVLAAGFASGRRPRIRDVSRLFLPAVIVGAAGLLFLSPYRRVAAESLAQKPIADGADIASFFLPGPDFWLFKGWLPVAPHGESNHFLGYLPLALGLMGLLTLAKERGRVPAARSFVAMAGAWFMGVGALVSIGAYPHFMGASLGASPYLVILNAVPTLRGMATVERAGVLVHIGLALLAAVGAERVLRHGRSPLLVLALAGLGAAEQWTIPRPGFRVPAGPALPPVYRSLASGRGPVVEVPVFPDRLLRFRALYPYFSTYHWRPVPLGRASFYPPAHDYLATLLQGFPDPVSIEALRSLDIRDIVVHPRMWSTRRGARLRALEGPEFELIESFPGDVSPAAASLEMGDERVYRLSPSASSGVPCVPLGEVDTASAVITSSASEGVSRLRDRSLATSWSTVRPQKEGDWIELLWTEPRAVAAIRLLFGPRPSEFPIALRVLILSPAGEWEATPESSPVASAVETLGQLIERDPQAGVTVRIEPALTRGIRLVLGRDADRSPWNPWSVAEIRLFSGCAAPPAGKS
ncbi:MAG TPA: hypothetical protein PLD86_01615 [Vicinamibacteria bacterium]|nr:hypothetical protein [Vicinamibacteria bacterium]